MNRSKKGVYPNILGQEVYIRAKKILELVSSCMENADTINQNRRGFTITYSRQFSLASFQTGLKELHNDFSDHGISLDLIIPNDQTILLCQDGNLWDQYVQKLFFHSNMTPSRFTYCYNSLLQRELILQHPHYVSIVSSLSVPDLDTDSINSLNDMESNLVYLPLNHEINQRKVYAVYPEDGENPEMVENVLDFICK